MAIILITGTILVPYSLLYWMTIIQPTYMIPLNDWILYTFWVSLYYACSSGRGLLLQCSLYGKIEFHSSSELLIRYRFSSSLCYFWILLDPSISIFFLMLGLPRYTDRELTSVITIQNVYIKNEAALQKANKFIFIDPVRSQNTTAKKH